MFTTLRHYQTGVLRSCCHSPIGALMHGIPLDLPCVCIRLAHSLCGRRCDGGQDGAHNGRKLNLMPIRCKCGKNVISVVVAVR